MVEDVDAGSMMMIHVAAGLAFALPLSPVGASVDVQAVAAGRPGDFDFLTGHWTIRHQRLVDGQWDRFSGEASVTGILGGIASVEELRIPERDFHGMGLRILDVRRQRWGDYWCNGSDGGLNAPVWGSFDAGTGIWDEIGTDGGITRGVWDQISQSSRWRQLVSDDGGTVWREEWIMHWQRVAT